MDDLAAYGDPTFSNACVIRGHRKVLENLVVYECIVYNLDLEEPEYVYNLLHDDLNHPRQGLVNVTLERPSLGSSAIACEVWSGIRVPRIS